jgi:hypothetical protein
MEFGVESRALLFVFVFVFVLFSSSAFFGRPLNGAIVLLGAVLERVNLLYINAKPLWFYLDFLRSEPLMGTQNH